jgi:hypothetical protein
VLGLLAVGIVAGVLLAALSLAALADLVESMIVKRRRHR